MGGTFLVGGTQYQSPNGPIDTMATISDSGTRAEVGDVRIGDFGQALVTVENGAFVSSKRLELSPFTGTGQLLITGQGSGWDASQIFSMKKGQFQVLAGGRLETLGGEINPSQGATAVGVISGAGSVWNLKSQPLFLGLDRRDAGQIRFSGGSTDLLVADGGTLRGSEIYLRYHGILRGGTIVGHLHVAGVAKPGRSPGTMTVDGNYEQLADGVLEMEIAGTGPGQFDVLSVTGATQLGGTLQLVFRDGFAPHAGDVFNLFEGLPAQGTFSSIEVAGLEPGWQYSLDTSSLRLTSLTDGVAVPEPATLVLFTFAAAGWCLRRGRAA